MGNLVNIKEKIDTMAALTLSMLKTTFDGFMKHDPDILAGVLKDEHRLNEMERAITASLIEASKGEISAREKKNIMYLTDIVGYLEEIGDYVKDMIERIEIKIQERLLFSEEALDEYKCLYHLVETALSNMVNACKLNDNNFAQMVVCNKENVDKLIEKYRNTHAQRLLCGTCDLRAGNMFLNLLDFTGQIFHHTQSVAKLILELK